jgi:hypothetical protein
MQDAGLGDGGVSQLSTRLQRLVDSGEAALAMLNVRHPERSLGCHLTSPTASFCGVAPHGMCFLIMFQFSMAVRVLLQCRLPLQVDNAGVDRGPSLIASSF